MRRSLMFVLSVTLLTQSAFATATSNSTTEIVAQQLATSSLDQDLSQFTGALEQMDPAEVSAAVSKLPMGQQQALMNAITPLAKKFNEGQPVSVLEATVASQAGQKTAGPAVLPLVLSAIVVYLIVAGAACYVAESLNPMGFMGSGPTWKKVSRCMGLPTVSWN